MLIPYSREAAVSYARQWAMKRNPDYYDYQKLGGDCTNFASQCLLAGGGVMDYDYTEGWYYSGANSHSPSWTAVYFLHHYLTRKVGIGPLGREVPMAEVMPGDISQFSEEDSKFIHTQVILSVGNPPRLDNILIAAHTDDSIDRALSTYKIAKIRFIHIEGILKDLAGGSKSGKA